jgi:hypothetical protein
VIDVILLCYDTFRAFENIPVERGGDFGISFLFLG